MISAFTEMALNKDVENGNNSLQAEVREPLIQQRKVLFHEENGPVSEDGTQNGSKESAWMVYLSTFVIIWGSFEFGSCVGYSSPTQAAIREDLNLSLGEALRTSIAFCLAGWISIYFAKGALALDIGRLATGYGMGVFSYVLMITSGLSVSFMIGNVLKWRTLALTGEIVKCLSFSIPSETRLTDGDLTVGLIPCIILLAGLSFIPESPRWLAKIGSSEEFEVALQKLRGKDADINVEAAEIQDYIDSLARLPKAKMLDLFHRRYMRSVIIGVGLMICQQFGGINGICFYTTEIFASAGFRPDIGTTIYACLEVVVVSVGAMLMDKAGRRVLLLTSATGTVIGCLLTGLSFYMKTHELALEAVPGIAVTGIMVYIGCGGIGMGAVPWVIMSEIFPINVKGVAGSLATLVNWFGAWFCSYTFNYLMSWSSYGTFFMYAVINSISVVFIAVMVPETKGRTLEEIQAAINKA
ncbi:hypothetical protein IFM89_006843 [Coptis chinensis]|uniref:Major facilitator superfamily (MFS) profile domain-containing protein n=1 Tax=Coptis chinensis TaxID=261450 RepID=A0A835HUE0_9MAGN|nr:hypothetical protein IFM89_006843 [Coptis chinensis]